MTAKQIDRVALTAVQVLGCSVMIGQFLLIVAMVIYNGGFFR